MSSEALQGDQLRLRSQSLPSNQNLLLFQSSQGSQQAINNFYPLQTPQISPLTFPFQQLNNENGLNLENSTLINNLSQQLQLLQQQQQQQRQFQHNINIQAWLQQIQLNQQSSQQQQALIPSSFLSLFPQQQSLFSSPLVQQQSKLAFSQFPLSLPHLVNQNQQQHQQIKPPLPAFGHSVKQEEQDDNIQEEIGIVEEEVEQEEEDQITIGQDLSRKNSSALSNQVLFQQQQVQNFLIQHQKHQGLQESQLDERSRASTAPVFFPFPDYQLIMKTPIPFVKQDIFSPNAPLSTQYLQHPIQQNQPQLSEFQLNSIVTMNKMSEGNTPTSEQIEMLKKKMGIVVRDKETLAPFLEDWNCKQENEQIIKKSYELLQNFSCEGSSAYENEFKVEYIESSQKCNYVNKFINSKGLIVKDEKFGKIKIENKISRFHNLSRLLMYTILTAFHKNNLALMNLGHLRQEAILKMIQRLKQSARKKTPKGLIKTDFFNHTHYNVLFLTINESNIDQVRKNPKDISTHFKVFNVDLEKPFHQIQEDLRYSNIIKKLAYHIMLASYKKSKDDKREQDLSSSCNSTFREQYIDRAMIGIGKLNQGILIQRF